MPIDLYPDVRPCQSCAFFVAGAENVGKCRRHAPCCNGWPSVYVNDSCGDHKVKGG